MGNDRLSRWFGLSYASFLTMPRVMMEDMPDDWQERMAILCEEWDETWVNQPDIGTRVQTTDINNRMVKNPEWLLNYRHPDRGQLNRMKHDPNHHS